MEQRTYFVIDMKSFFASVECAERGLDAMTTNLIVADESRTDKTICLAVSPSLKKLGVRNRCRLFEVPKNLEYIIAKPRMKKYIEYAAKIYAIYLKYIDKSDIHVYSIDECIIDATDYLKIYKLHPKQFAMNLMQEINDALHIPASAGIGSNMYLAKIALDITAKHSPNRIGWLTEELYKKDLWTHRPITDFWQISTGIASRLERYGIYDMKGISTCDEILLYREFGVNAELLIDHSNGKESCLMKDIKNYKTSSKSFSNSQILACGYSFDSAKTILLEMIQEGCYRLSANDMSTNLLHIYIAFDDKSKSAKGTSRMNETTNLYSKIKIYAENLFNNIIEDKTKLIKRIAFDFDCLTDDSNEQYNMFTDLNKVTKEKKLTKSILEIKNKFGKNSLLKGIDLKSDSTQKERNNMVGGHNG